MVVVDTNILAYLLLEGEHTEAARSVFARDPTWRSDAFILIEFTNILATYARLGDLTHAQCLRLLNDAQAVVQDLVDIPHGLVLATARRYRVSAYDARFLAAASSLGSKLITEDARLKAAAPALTCTLTEYLASDGGRAR